MPKLLPRPGHKPKHREHARRLFRADVSDVATIGVLDTYSVATLRLRRGAHATITDDEGAFVEERHEPEKRMTLNLGDRPIVMGPELDDTALVVVDKIAAEGYGERVHVRVLRGRISPSAPKAWVWLMPACRARAA